MKRKFAIALVVVALMLAPEAQASFSVTATSSFVSASTTTIPIAFSTGAHDLLVVFEGESSATTTPPTDSAGNTYTLATTTTNLGTGGGAMYYVANALATATSTCNFNLSSNVSCTIFDITGAATSSPLDSVSAMGQAGSVTIATSTPLTTSNANDILIFGVRAGNNQGTWTGGTGYTIPPNGTSTREAMQYQTLTATTTATTTSISWTVAGNSMGVFAAFKAPVTQSAATISPRSRGQIITSDW